MNGFETLELDLQKGVGIIWLNRPKVRNAFNDQMIEELSLALGQMETNDNVRVIVIGGRGSVFCAGADLNHMKKMATYNYGENLHDSHKLALLLLQLYTIKKPTLARVHGHAFAGGMGLLSACDIAIASFNVEFCLSEVRLGLIPATIGPYVTMAVGERVMRRYMLTAERFSAAEAYRVGLVHEIAPADKLDEKIDDLLTAIIHNGPNSLAACKDFLRSIAGQPPTKEMSLATAEKIAQVRSSEEGKEGINSFLEKRAPSWISVE